MLDMWTNRSVWFGGRAARFMACCALAGAPGAAVADSLPNQPLPARPVERYAPPSSFHGHAVSSDDFRKKPLPRPSGHLRLRSANFGETVDVNLYAADGSFNEESLSALYHLWRCRRSGTERPIHPQLFVLLSIIQDHYPDATLDLISGFRNQDAAGFHLGGSAADIRIEGVTDRALHTFVSTLDNGHMGLGLYPRSGFIHVDVRAESSYRWVDHSPSSDRGRPRHSS